MLLQDLDIKEQEEEQLPNLLNRHVQRCKTAAGSKRQKVMGPQRNTVGELRKLESSQSLAADRKEHKDIREAAWGHRQSAPVASAPNQRAFPVMSVPLVRWRAAARIKAHIKKWRNYMAPRDCPSTEDALVIEVAEEVAAPASEPYNQLFPEEPAPPTREDLVSLAELEALLLEHHGNLEAAYKYITNCVKKGAKDATGFTKRELRLALHLKGSKEGGSQEASRQRLEMLEGLFDSLMALHRKPGADEILRSEFLLFPELLKREQDLQSRLLPSDKVDEDKELLIGSRLQQRLATRPRSSEEALELLEMTTVALQLEPCRTANLLCQISGSAATPSDALVSGITSIMRIVHEFGAPNTGTKFDVLIAGWTLCNALTKQIGNLAAQSEGQSSAKSCQKKMISKPTKVPSKFQKKYQAKVDVAPSTSNQDEVNAALWQALSLGEVLWNLGCGAEVLNDEDFKTLLQTAWGLFNSFDAVGYLLGPVGLGRLQPKLDSLLNLNLDPNILASNPEHAHVQLSNANTLLQQITVMVEADPRLARVAALFGTSYVANRIRSTANSSVNLVEGAAGSAAAQVNRSAVALAELLVINVEELMGGRKVQVSLTSGQYTIKPAESVVNPLANWQSNITAQVMERATVKKERRSSAPCVMEQAQELRPKELRPMEKFLLGYNNLN